MPEGDTIHRLAERVEGWFAGQPVIACQDEASSLRVRPLEKRILLGATSHGKHLLMRFEEGWTLHSHLRMHGSWSTSRPGLAKSHLPRLGLRFPSGTLWGVGLPLLDLYPTSHETRRLVTLGPDLIREPLDAERLRERLARYADQPLTGVLLRQEVAAGLGNLYAVEIPFLLGLSPFLPVIRLRKSTAQPWVVGAALLRANACLGPQTTTGFRKTSLLHYVYGKGGRPCPVCGARIKALREGATAWGRSVWWCPSCQSDQHDMPDLDRAKGLLRRHLVALGLLQGNETRLRKALDLPRQQRGACLF